MDTTKCKEWVERDKQVIAPCQHLSYFPLAVEKGEGSVITDVDGNRFIDFLSSASSLNLGSSDPVITQAICTLCHKDPSVDLQQLLYDQGVLTVSGADFEGLGANTVRVRVPEQQSVSRLVDAVAAAAKE